MDSAFDLSPSERLQLVEDLWDSLASEPGDVPVHEWQLEEAARRRENLLKDPASGLSWEELKRRIRAPMAANHTISPEAESDLREAYAWYEQRRFGLGEEFLSSIDACVARICRNPEMFEIVRQPYRRALVRRFPYAVLFEYSEGLVKIYCIVHTARDEGKWRRRLP